MDTFQFLMVFIVLVPILFLSYITTRFVAGKSSKAMKGKHINIIETVSLGTDKKLHLISVGGKHLLISSSGKSVEFLAEVPLEEGSQETEVSETQATFDFKKLFDKYLQNYKVKKLKNPYQNSEEAVTEDKDKEPSFRKNLNRLKAITGTMDGRRQQDGDEYQ